jgi:nucleoside-diphosphate-sugar epimerase
MEKEVAGFDGSVDPTIVRFSTLFYRDPVRDGLSKLIHTAKKEGRVSVIDCWRDFLPLETACHLLHSVCVNRGGNAQVLNLGSGVATSLLAVALYLRETYGTEVSFKEGSGGDICSVFPFPEFYGLPAVKVDIYKEIDAYYKSI